MLKIIYRELIDNMKKILGDILFVLGLTLFMACAYKDLSFWFWIISVIVIIAGMELIIDGKIDNLRERIIGETTKK